MPDENESQILTSQKRKLQIINGLRACNAFIGTLVSTWSAVALLAPFVLAAILGYFGILFVFPLWSICLIAVAVGLAVGIYTAIKRYEYLDVQSEEFEFYSLDFANEALERSSPKTKSTGKRLLFWESVNTFVADSQKIFSLAGMIILVVSGVFGLVPHPAAFAIAVVAAIAYGVASSVVRGSQVNYRLESIHALENEFEEGEELAGNHVTEANRTCKTLTIEIQTCQEIIRELNTLPQQNAPSQKSLAYLHTFRNKITLQGNTDDINTPVTNEAEVLQRLNLYSAHLKTELEAATTHRQHIVSLAAQITSLKLDVHRSFTDQDKWRVGYHLFMGGFGGGSFAYILFGVFHIVVVSLPVLAAIIAGVVLLYGISSAYFKIESIKREKWLAVDYEKATKKHEELNKLIEQVEPSQNQQATVNTPENTLTDSSLFSVYASPIKSAPRGHSALNENKIPFPSLPDPKQT